ncbi:hypothetical protein [Haliscomenobacter hydrossis]|uniref:DUF3592 domain-containing protein n=1 Tax=Haliscomenobacter hydrossis (strain ATCC 27775 / DSM 1100 / LMG 10767 / O) TaxID=760192 RepID=F4KZD4_HALH1|nr:hypothetical protein [Haliscomenobacter hydrossis]AEE48429.1 hypothetical protein Halhy_0519 [Haliscomenobacter hydrossis DSM 1100]
MKAIGILFIIFSILSGLLGVRSYLRDDAYAKASVVVNSSVKWAEVKPNPWKSTVSIKLMLIYMRDGVADSLEHNYSQFYSKDNPLPTIEKLKAATPPIRYLPKEKRSKNIPDWVMVSNKDKHDGVYGQTGFSWMLNFLIPGIFLIIYSRVRRKSRELFSLQK